MARKPERHTASLRTDPAYQANGPGQVAQHTEAVGAGPGGKAAVVQVPCAVFSGESSIPGPPGTGCGATGNRRVAGGGGSRGPSAAEAKAGRPAPVGCSAPRAPDPVWASRGAGGVGGAAWRSTGPCPGADPLPGQQAARVATGEGQPRGGGEGGEGHRRLARVGPSPRGAAPLSPGRGHLAPGPFVTAGPLPCW